MRKVIYIFLFLFLMLPFLSNTIYAQVSNWQKSASFYPTYNTDFSSSSFKQSLSNFAALGGNYATLIVPFYQSNLHTTDIFAGSNTPTDQSLIDAINYAHSLGLQVMIKPHVDSLTGEWRAFIEPADKAAWFNSYNKILNHLTSIAVQTKVEEISIGAELTNMTNNNTQDWINLINQTRSSFNGKLTYSAQRDGFEGQLSSIGFWSNLDYIGISAYYDLATNQPNPSVDNLISSWDTWNKTQIQPISQQYKKPILFTEIGYKSITNAHSYPWAYDSAGSPDQDEQNKLYEALFTYWNNQPFMQGIHIWDWITSPTAGGANNTDYTPQNKTTQATIAKWFGASGSPVPTSTPAPTASPTASPIDISTPGGGLLTNTWNFLAQSGSNEKSQGIPSNTLNGASVLSLTYNLHGSCILTGDASAIVFDQPAGNWHYVSLSNYGNNCLNGSQTVEIPLSSFPGLNLSQPVSSFHARFWLDKPYNIDITEAFVNSREIPAPTATPTPAPTPAPSPSTTPAPSPSIQPDNFQAEIWWPTDGISVSGLQPFKAIISGLPLTSYQMFWQVDGGGLNQMSDSQANYPHKESLVDVNFWNWRESGPYRITFIAKDLSGNIIAQRSISIFITR